MLVGLVGCGRWGTHILRDLRALGCDVRVLARSTETEGRAAAGGGEAVARMDDLDGVAGIVVATPTTTHADVLEQALELGVPVFVEKPLCDDAAAASRLAARAPGHLFVMDKWRYHPGVQTLGDIARSHVLGRVRGLRTLRMSWGTAHDDVDAVWVLGPHDLAIALQVLGEILTPTAAAADDTDGFAASLVGLMAGDGRWHTMELSARSPERMRRVELHCDDGVAVLGGGWDDHITVYRRSDGTTLAEERVPTPGELPLLAELRAFVAHLSGGPPPMSSAAEGALAVQTLAQLRSLAGIS